MLYDSKKDEEYFDELVAQMTAGPCLVLCLAKVENATFHLFIFQRLMLSKTGESTLALLKEQQKKPQKVSALDSNHPKLIRFTQPTLKKVSKQKGRLSFQMTRKRLHLSNLMLLTR